MTMEKLLEKAGNPYSKELGIDIKSCREDEICKWFLASILFGKRINETIAMKTYMELENFGLTRAKKIADAKWEDLVQVLDVGGYVRYDFSTADRLKKIFGNLDETYGGDLNKIHYEAKDSKDLEDRIKGLGKGIGNVTVSIFLRDMRYCWEKVDPRPTALVKLAMDYLGIDNLKEFSREKKADIVRVETMFFRIGRYLRRKKRAEVPDDSEKRLKNIIEAVMDINSGKEVNITDLSELTGTDAPFMVKLLKTMGRQTTIRP